MDFQQKRRRYRLEWKVEEEGIKVHQKDPTGEREYYVPFENISIFPTLLEIAPNKNPQRRGLIIPGCFFVAFALATFAVWLTDPPHLKHDSVAPFVFFTLVSAIMFFCAFWSRSNLRYISSAYGPDTAPLFWFFLPKPTEEAQIVQFLDKVYHARNAYYRDKFMPQIAEAKTPHGVHSLVCTLLREKVLTEAEFEEFKSRFAPQKARIGFLA